MSNPGYVKRSGGGSGSGSNMSTSNRNDRNARNEGTGKPNYNKDRNGGGHDSSGTQKVRKQTDSNYWFESSEFCRTNRKTGDVKWKEEFWTNGPDMVHMVTPSKDGRKLEHRVPSTWQFQNCDYGNYESRESRDSRDSRNSKQTFAFESAFNLHSKSSGNPNLVSRF